MAGTHSFTKLRAQMSPEARAAGEAEALRLGEGMDLAQVRQAPKLSQAELGRELHIGQASIAKIEKRTDMYVSTLRRFFEGMGGELEIIARFPETSVMIRIYGALSGDEAEAG
jgi:hypothetical protein